MNDYQIRRAESKDAPILAVLAIQVWLDTYTKGVTGSHAEYVLAEFTPERMLTLIAENTVWVAACDETLLGFAVLNEQQTSEHGAELSTLYVQSRMQKKGVGHALFAAVRAQCPKFWVSAYHANHNAIAFYLRQGMQQVGICDFMLGKERHENMVFAIGGVDE
ncbi:GNAT family N-acetyltransferase [Chitinibacter bivalviorum]|uniref:GNAT family N-acetyltransferase n=1 Tax=Chitinibacter bivalviorum TaxID=2739434 RepID=A0A7H9BJE6_9NEIS|nr:GNAT family N-acetyltransferase [Chitinibacter bivalviorum]QLG88797.1 GNAT family N-acetyltransferase [Chitinibacter bivalviorum]